MEEYTADANDFAVVVERGGRGRKYWAVVTRPAGYAKSTYDVRVSKLFDSEVEAMVKLVEFVSAATHRMLHPKQGKMSHDVHAISITGEQIEDIGSLRDCRASEAAADARRALRDAIGDD